MRRILILVIVMLSASLCRAEPPQPNVVLILVDDLGWRDPGFMGSDFHQTPHIDRLAARGMVFTNAYAAAPNCTPARASLLTGMTTPRTGIFAVRKPDRTRPLIPPNNMPGILAELTTIAEALFEHGYLTIHVGKWHVGTAMRHQPREQGFRRSVGDIYAGNPRSYTSPFGLPGLGDVRRGTDLTTYLTDQAIEKLQKPRARPVFLYFAPFAVHGPIQADPKLVKKYESREPGDIHSDPTYAAMVENLDTNVGRLLDVIDELDRPTIVILSSDNGGADAFTSNAPLRGGKGSLHEGGIRVPMVVHDPRNNPESRRSDVPVSHIDILPTVLELIGEPQQGAFEGISLVRLLQAPDAALPRDALYWHFPMYAADGSVTPCGAIRQGDWKLIEYFETGAVELYDLVADPSESVDRAAEHPEKAAALRAALHAWREARRAAMPRPNPEYNPAETSLQE
jgi:arylsulfatase A-like enzyme